MLSVFSRARKQMGRAVVALSALALAACQPIDTAGTAPAASRGGAVQVALLVPSGSGKASDEDLARALENAARLAIRDLGTSQILLQVYPTAGQAGNAAAQAQKAVGAGADIILGPLYAAEANAVGAAVPQNISVLAFSNNTSVAGGNVFVLGQTFQNTARRLASYAQGRNSGRMMIVYDSTAAGEAGRAAITAGAQQAGATIVGQEGYSFSQNGIQQAAPGIAQRAQGAGANSVFLTADTAGALPAITAALRSNGLAPEMVQFIGLTRWDIPAETLGLPSLQGGWFAQPDPALWGGYVQRYTQAYGRAPHPVSGLAYDGVAAIGALVKAGKPLSRPALTQSAGFAGTGGAFRLLPDGTNERALAVSQISNNQVSVIDPAPRSFRGGFGF
ncbi:penicillin-binding protein activator [Falsirhodobacter sp. 20TX0035]|uniref:penicillin-binding protein activator n=1 Tax=Falsirhodobacter sp. 20TX0035 TaxID=3022019 RepID=UPI00232D999E|nr:penicillin-binding protein activator [Falsirhodobacter sp. 20TX0035]MDB6453856.1 penicillin-binding protein activator [Falsirhodobacter sp. 20TX0035]